MSKRSRKRSAAKGNELPLDRPFDPQILRRARKIASKYRLIIEPEEDLGYLASAVELPNVWGDGKTAEKCIRDVREALTTVVAYMLEQGQEPPIPSVERKRQEQINIRVTVEEKLLLEEAARSRGFRGVSDFIRTATLAAVRE